MRIIVGITSYMDELTIGVTGDGEYAADVDVLVAGIQAGFDELCNAAAAKSGSSSRTEERKPKPPGKAAVKKAAPKKTASKKSAPKKTASKKSAVKKTASKKSAVKKTAVKKTASKRTTPPKETSY